MVIKIKPMESIKQDILGRISHDEYLKYIQSEEVHTIVKLSQIENYYGAAAIFTILGASSIPQWLEITGIVKFIVYGIGLVSATYFFLQARIYHDEFIHKIADTLTNSKMEYWKLRIENDKKF